MRPISRVDDLLKACFILISDEPGVELLSWNICAFSLTKSYSSSNTFEVFLAIVDLLFRNDSLIGYKVLSSVANPFSLTDLLSSNQADGCILPSSMNLSLNSFSMK